MVVIQAGLPPSLRSCCHGSEHRCGAGQNMAAQCCCQEYVPASSARWRCWSKQPIPEKAAVSKRIGRKGSLCSPENPASCPSGQMACYRQGLEALSAAYFSQCRFYFFVDSLLWSLLNSQGLISHSNISRVASVWVNHTESDDSQSSGSLRDATLVVMFVTLSLDTSSREMLASPVWKL